MGNNSTKTHFKCDKFQFLSKNNSDMSEHMREKHRIFKCDNCDFTSSSDVGLKIHTTKSHAESSPALKVSLDHSEKRSHICFKCLQMGSSSSSFATMEELEDHLNRNMNWIVHRL